MKFTDGIIDGNNLLEILSSVICVLSMSSLVISHYLFDHKTPMSQIQIKFHQFTNKYNFRKFQTHPNMYKSYIHTTNFYGKKL